jgi:hypothetical protein
VTFTAPTDCVPGTALNHTVRAVATNGCDPTGVEDSKVCGPTCQEKPAVEADCDAEGPDGGTDVQPGDAVTVTGYATNLGTEPADLTITIYDPDGFVLCTETFPGITGSATVTKECIWLVPSNACQDGPENFAFAVEAKAVNSCGEITDRDDEDCAVGCRPRELCWMTAGGHNSGGDDAGQKYWTWGGNVGPPPSGEWQHHEFDGEGKTLYNFHAHDVNINFCEQIDPGPCHPRAPVNTIHFFGTGTYSIGNGKKEHDASFVARVEDHNEPGNTPDEDRGCGGDPDIYYIKVTDTATNTVIFEHTEEIDGGNLQIHELKENQIRGDRLGRTDLSSTGSGDAIAGDGIAVGRLELYRPAPNPFNNTTSIAYAVGGTGDRVEIGIYNVAGRLVRKLVSGYQSAGYHEATWDARSDAGVQVSPGVYFLKGLVGNERISGTRILYLR